MSEASSLRRPGAWLALVPALLVSLSVLWVGTMRGGPELPVELHFRDKVGHALAFALVAWVYYRPARHFVEGNDCLALRRRAALLAFVGATLLGAVLEVIQAGLAHRSAEWLDLVADALGAGAVAACLAWWPTGAKGGS